MAYPKFVLTDVTHGDSGRDIICFQTDIGFQAFREYCQSVSASYVVITEEDACKLLLAGDGIGANCYIMQGAKASERYYRSAVARVKAQDICGLTGFIITTDPIEICIDTTEANEAESLDRSIVNPMAPIASLALALI